MKHTGSTALAAELAATKAALADCKLQAQCHAIEARGANQTIGEIYQIVTGSTGEPGNWNGAVPVKDKFDALNARIAELEAALTNLRPLGELIARGQLTQPRKTGQSIIKIIDAALTAKASGGEK